MLNKNFVRIVRFANEGFNCSVNKNEVFYDYEVLDYSGEQKINISEKPIIYYNLQGCYSFFYKFNEGNLKGNGILAMRNSHTMNVGYLPLDYLVYVRNMQPDIDKSRIIKVYKNVVNPVDYSIHEFEDDSYWNCFRWVKMKLFLAIQRTEEYLEKNRTSVVPEALSEVFLTPDDVARLSKRTRRCFWFPKNFIPLYKK